MLYSFQLETKELDEWMTITVNDGLREYKLTARAGHSRHVYTNLPVSARPQLTIPCAGTVTELSYGHDSYMRAEQKQANRTLINRGTPYMRSVKGTPRRAVVTFAHFKGHGGWASPYPVFNGEKLELNDCLYLSFQDPYFHLGSYLLSDNYGNDPKPGVVQAIRDELSIFGLDESAATLLGASKGAATALMVSERLSGNQLVLCSLSTDLDFPVRKSRYAHIGVALDFYGVTYPKIIDLLLSEASSKDTHWFYSVGDDAANRGNESRIAPFLTKYASESEHARVIVDNLPRIASIVDSFKQDPK